MEQPLPNLTLPSVQTTPSKIIYRASSLGSCPRSLWASRKSYTRKPYPSKFLDIFSRGHEIEDITKSILSAAGWVIINNDYEVHVDLGPIIELLPVWILGHIDCDSKILPDQQYVLTEIKGFGKSFLDRYIEKDILGFPQYAYQVSAYLHARQQTRWRLIIYKKTTTSPEDSFDRLVIRDYESPPLSLDDLRNRVVQVESMVELHNDPTKVPCLNNYPCQYYYLHDTPESITLTDSQVSIARAIKVLDKKLETLQATKKKFRDSLQRQLSQVETITKFKSSLGDVSISLIDNPDRLDQKAAREILRLAEVTESEYMSKGTGKQIRITIKDKSS